VRFDVVFSLALVVALMAVLLERLLYYEEYAEKAMVEVAVTSMRAGLHVRRAEAVVARALGQEVGMPETNPVRWLGVVPPNYAGEFDGPAPPGAGDGIWFYDRLSRELVYRPSLQRHFLPDAAGRREVRVRFVRREPSPATAGAARSLPWEGAAVVLSRPYEWF
jgi:hypothetical protein